MIWNGMYLGSFSILLLHYHYILGTIKHQYSHTTYRSQESSLTWGMKLIEWIWLSPEVPGQDPEFLEQFCGHVETPRALCRSRPAPNRHSPLWDAHAPLSDTDRTRYRGSGERMRVHAPGHPSARAPVPGWGKPLLSGSDCRPLRRDQVAGARTQAPPWQHWIKARTRLGLITHVCLASISRLLEEFWHAFSIKASNLFTLIMAESLLKISAKRYCCHQNYCWIWRAKHSNKIMSPHVQNPPIKTNIAKKKILP